jgi:hypothetical protein
LPGRQDGDGGTSDAAFIAAARAYAPWSARLLKDRVLPLLREIDDTGSGADYETDLIDLIAEIERGCGEG